MPKFETLKVGEKLYDCHRQKMGNTTMGAWGLWEVEIVGLDANEKRALVRLNGNRPQWWYPDQLARLSRKIPKRYTDQQERRKRTGSWL